MEMERKKKSTKLNEDENHGRLTPPWGTYRSFMAFVQPQERVILGTMPGLKPKTEIKLRVNRLTDSQKLAVGGPLQCRRDGGIPRATNFVHKARTSRDQAELTIGVGFGCSDYRQSTTVADHHFPSDLRVLHWYARSPAVPGSRISDFRICQAIRCGQDSHSWPHECLCWKGSPMVEQMTSCRLFVPAIADTSWIYPNRFVKWMFLSDSLRAEPWEGSKILGKTAPLGSGGTMVTLGLCSPRGGVDRVHTQVLHHNQLRFAAPSGRLVQKSPSE